MQVHIFSVIHFVSDNRDNKVCKRWNRNNSDSIFCYGEDDYISQLPSQFEKA